MASVTHLLAVSALWFNTLQTAGGRWQLTYHIGFYWEEMVPVILAFSGLQLIDIEYFPSSDESKVSWIRDVWAREAINSQTIAIILNQQWQKQIWAV